MVLKTVLGVFFIQSGLQPCLGSGNMDDDPISNQLMDFSRNNPVAKNYTTASGTLLPVPGVVLTLGKKGPIVMDPVYIEEIRHLNRERIPERVVHAKGAGAWGYFTVTNSEITKYCSAAIFSKVGKVTSAFARFSVSKGESGSADTIRGVKGFAVKFYTEEGNWDLLTLNFKAFNLRDPMLFPSQIHMGRRNPVTHLRDETMRWDFLSKTPSTVLFQMILAGSHGHPLTYRHMDGFALNTFKLVNAKGEVVFCKFILKTQQGLAFLEEHEAERLRGEDPDYYSRDLYNSIARGHHPKWTLGVQIMTKEQTKTFRWNFLDPTKFWPEDEFPFLPIGVLTFHKNPTNFFSEVEQSGFTPNKLVPGIEPSEEKLLQGRLFAYEDTTIYRLGINNDLVPVNAPLGAPPVANRNRDGKGRIGKNQAGAPNYVPNSYHGPQGNPRGLKSSFPVYGNVTKYDTMNEDNFSQATYYWNKISEAERNLTVKILAGSLANISPFIQKRAINNFEQVHPDFGRALQTALATKG